MIAVLQWYTFTVCFGLCFDLVRGKIFFHRLQIKRRAQFSLVKIGKGGTDLSTVVGAMVEDLGQTRRSNQLRGCVVGVVVIDGCHDPGIVFVVQ